MDMTSKWKTGAELSASFTVEVGNLDEAGWSAAVPVSAFCCFQPMLIYSHSYKVNRLCTSV